MENNTLCGTQRAKLNCIKFLLKEKTFDAKK